MLYGYLVTDIKQKLPDITDTCVVQCPCLGLLKVLNVCRLYDLLNCNSHKLLQVCSFMETFTANILKKQVIKRAQHFYEDFNCKVAGATPACNTEASTTQQHIVHDISVLEHRGRN